MYKILTKHGQLAAFSVGLLVIVLFVGSVLSGVDGFNALSKEDQLNTTIFDIGIMMTLVLLVVCAVIAVLFAIYQMATNPKGAIKGIVAMVVLAILFAILYSTAAAETTGPVGKAVEDFNLTEGESKLVTAGIKSTLILGGIAVAAFIVSEVRNLFK